MTTNLLTPKEAIEIVLHAQLALDENNSCQAESLLALLVARLNETAQIESFKDKKHQEIFDYYNELNSLQDDWMKKDEPN